MKNFEPVNIIGGGISGLTIALTLKTLGIKYNLFEKNAEITYDNVGLGISANVFHILKEWNLLSETKAIGTEIQKLYFVDKKLNYIKVFKLQKPALSVNRKLFYKLLVKQLGEENIHLNSLKSINDFLESDIVVSADGIDSKIRQNIYPNLKLRHSNQILWRGISKIKLEEKFENSYYDFIDNNIRFATIHTGRDYYSWYAIKEKTNSNEGKIDKAILKTFFEGFHPVVNEVIDQTEDIYFSELLDINPKVRKNLNWFKNNKIMIGDAIHPSTPNMANGACLAIEDSYLLANLFNNDSFTLEEIYKTFQKQRTKKVDKIIFQSWWFGKLLHQKNKILARLIKLGMVLTPQFLFDKIYSNVLIETKIKQTHNEFHK